MTAKIICEVMFDKLEKNANDLEKKGFVPIAMTNEHVQNGSYYTCILMHKKE